MMVMMMIVVVVMVMMMMIILMIVIIIIMYARKNALNIRILMPFSSIKSISQTCAKLAANVSCPWR